MRVFDFVNGSRLFPSFRRYVTPVKTGVHPHPPNWIPFFNGMRDALLDDLRYDIK